MLIDPAPRRKPGPNRLYYGDNLPIMREIMPRASVDLIYLDPPFKSNQNYNLIYKTLTGKPVPDQAEAFCDTWDMDAEKEKLGKGMPELLAANGVDASYVRFWRYWMMALRDAQPHLLAYLIYMVQRLVYMKTILKPTGSIYLHCDPTASHYIKVMMDGIFGHRNFLNEIIWRRTGSHNSAQRFGPIHDVILFYSKSDTYTWNDVRRPYMKGHVEKAFKQYGDQYRTNYSGNVLSGSGRRGGESGKPWRGFDPDSKGRHWAIPRKIAMELGEDLSQLSTHEKLDYLYEQGLVTIKAGDEWPRYSRAIGPDDGLPLPDLWAYQPYTEGTQFGTEVGIDDDVRWMGTIDGERLGYPTQKPIGLLRRIIESSSRRGDVIFDPFCGCGTTIYAAHELERQWIGCDIAILAVKLIREVLAERYRLEEGTHFVVAGIPVSVEQAEELFGSNRSQFQNWAVERAGGFPTKSMSGDRGIDGRLYFETKDGLKSMVLSVKGGHLKPADVRDLRGVLEREDETELAGFISLKEPTRAMRAEAEQAGMYEYAGVSYKRIQLLSIREMLEEKREFRTPTKMGSRIATGQILLPGLAP